MQDARFRLIVFTLLFALLPLLACSDPASNDPINDGDTTDGDTTDGDTTDGDLDSTGRPTLLDYLTVYCPWQNACEGDSLNTCLDDLMGMSLHYDEWVVRLENAGDRLTCMNHATSCEDFSACFGDNGSDDDYGLGPMSPYEGDLTCDEIWQSGYDTACMDDKILLWCPGDYQETPGTYDCTYFGWVCAQDTCCDAGSPPCTQQSCDGPIAQSCYRGCTASSDCRIVDPDFECATERFDGGEQLNCQLPKAEWECTEPKEPICNGDQIQLCAAGKLINFDCPKALGSVCKSYSDDSSASCSDW